MHHSFGFAIPLLHQVGDIAANTSAAGFSSYITGQCAAISRFLNLASFVRCGMVTELNQLIAEHSRRIREADAALPITEICDRVSRLISGMAQFWTSCSGWAPADVATLFSEARLDRIASLSWSLKRWVVDDGLSDGDLILAWTNLGSVTEGALKYYYAPI